MKKLFVLTLVSFASFFSVKAQEMGDSYRFFINTNDKVFFDISFPYTTIIRNGNEISLMSFNEGEGNILYTTCKNGKTIYCHLDEKTLSPNINTESFIMKIESIGKNTFKIYFVVEDNNLIIFRFVRVGSSLGSFEEFKMANVIVKKNYFK